MRSTIRNHDDFLMSDEDPTAKNTLFIVRAKAARFPTNPRYGLVATRKTFRHAVERNRAKRLLRDWIAVNEKLMAPQFDYVFIARIGILDATREEGRESMNRALRYIKAKFTPKKKKSKQKNVTK